MARTPKSSTTPVSIQHLTAAIRNNKSEFAIKTAEALELLESGIQRVATAATPDATPVTPLTPPTIPFEIQPQAYSQLTAVNAYVLEQDRMQAIDTIRFRAYGVDESDIGFWGEGTVTDDNPATFTPVLSGVSRLIPQGLSAVNVTNGGSAYTTITISFTGGVASGARGGGVAHGVLLGGVLQSIVIDDPGVYDSAPTVVITGDGTLAAATSEVGVWQVGDFFLWNDPGTPDDTLEASVSTAEAGTVQLRAPQLADYVLIGLKLIGVGLPASQTNWSITVLGDRANDCTALDTDEVVLARLPGAAGASNTVVYPINETITAGQGLCARVSSGVSATVIAYYSTTGGYKYEICQITAISNGDWTISRGLLGSPIAEHTDALLWRLQPRLFAFPTVATQDGIDAVGQTLAIPDLYPMTWPSARVIAVTSNAMLGATEGPTYTVNLSPIVDSGDPRTLPLSPGTPTFNGNQYILGASGAVTSGSVADARHRITDWNAIRCLWAYVFTDAADVPTVDLVINACYLPPDLSAVALLDTLTITAGSMNSYQANDLPSGRFMPYHVGYPLVPAFQDWPAALATLMGGALDGDGKLDPAMSPDTGADPIPLQEDGYLDFVVISGAGANVAVAYRT